MILHFLRHAQAEPAHGVSHNDRERVLTQEGRDTMRHAAQGFLKMGLDFDRILSSPYPRAVESAQIFADIFQFERQISLTDNLTPDALFHKFRKELLTDWSQFKSLLIVTHQPFVSECIAFFLTGTDIPLAVDMGTGTLCTVEIDKSLTGPGILVSMIRAEAAARMGGAPLLKKG